MTRARSALLLLGGELRSAAAAKSAARRADLVLCADGGARHALKLGLIPDAVVGDMDSLPRLPRSWRAVARVLDRDEDRGDLDKTLDHARRLGARDVSVAAALGGDLGHALVNLAVLERRGRDFELSLLDGGGARLLGPGRHALPLKRGTRFTLLAAPHARVSLSGALYPLKNAVLSRGSRGLGNRATGKTVLTVRAGLVWLAVDSNDPA